MCCYSARLWHGEPDAISNAIGVIADVQAVLQEMGYCRGEVDGLLGPLTREALTAYQADNGLTTTAAIDQPTLDSLGMG